MWGSYMVGEKGCVQQLVELESVNLGDHDD